MCMESKARKASSYISVDLREQERRARLLLLDGIREPSPQPIFGEPVKVELEDETARRIKNTLGDVTQVLINDPKSLIGISRSAPNSIYTSNGHQVSGHPSSSHPMSGLPSNSHPMSGHSSNSHPISGHTNSHSLSGNSSNSHLMSGHSSSSHSMSGHQPSSHPMSGHSSNSHLVSSHQTNTHLMSGHQSNTHPFTGHQTIAHSIAGHQSNTHPITGHPSNTHPMTGHPSSSHPITGHPSNSHLISGHTSSSHPITGHPSNSHSLTGHSTNSHLITGHPNNSHPTTGHPSNSHPLPGHTTGGLPSNGYHMTGHPVNVNHPIPGHPSNGHPISGYTATGYSGAGHVNAPSRPQAASKKVPIPANNNLNVSKPSNPNMPNMFPKVAPDKRNSYNRQKPDSPVTSKPFHTSSFNSVEITQHQIMQPHYQAQDNRAWNTEQKKTSSNLPFSVNLNFSGGTYNNVTIGDINVHSGTTSAPIWSCGPETPAIQVTPFHLPPCVTPSTAIKPVYNFPGVAPNLQQKFDIANNTSPVKRPVNRPSHLKIERKPTSPIGVETILKEMTKPVPAPLTAIQTPRTEETGFAFPPEPKEELIVVKTDEKANPSNIPQEQKSSYICQPSPIVKSVSPFPNLQSQNQLQTGLVTVKIEKPEPPA
ncbi:uncharacterized protein DDB_G0283357 isoform X3 [Parasteatoda tepidariorum]|uniref:uncharacterized protein DDB_G0283357 isoform X3 n=1 Tax=Parasteatoda tepidariorum TaxID=114398 RepID=UPI00077FC90D|nr:mucin-12 isoform X3 [Parasteatoda tepidariorum]